eukprot:389910_1
MERFQIVGKNGSITNNNMTFKKNGTYSYCTAYGSLDIDPNTKDTHTWRFRIINCGIMKLGIDESVCKWKDRDFTDYGITTQFYAFRAHNSHSMGYKVQFPGDSISINDGYASGDYATMIVNLNNLTLDFYVNNKHL